MQFPSAPSLASRTRVMLAVLFGLIAVGVVGMHLLSADHRLATPGSSAHHGVGVVMRADDTHHHGGAETIPGPGAVAGAAAFLVPAGVDHGCADCDRHTVMIGSCLLALMFGVLRQLLAPARGRSWPTLDRSAPDTPASPSVAARTHRVALTHLELSICRT